MFLQLQNKYEMSEQRLELKMQMKPLGLFANEIFRRLIVEDSVPKKIGEKMLSNYDS